MGLASLDAALAGLRVSQQQIDVISNNVANVNTPGYSRKILPQNAQSVLGTTVGVRTETIIRNVDLNLERDLWTQVSAVGFLDVQQSFLGRIEQFHGNPELEISVGAEVARLRDSFSALADSPDDPFLLINTLNQAADTADKINDFSRLITQLRNDTQEDINSSVENINALLVQIADLNSQIQNNTNVGRTTALLEDQRDQAINELSEQIEISFFQRGDGVLVVQTNQGVELASEKPQILTFSPRPVSSVSFYPDSINGVFVGNPSSDPSAVDLTTLEPGGRLGGLLQLRDDILPRQTAQIDELAHKLALRTQAQGLRLFTDQSGTVPLDTPPDPTTVPPTPVPYVGFAANIRVNQSVINDNNLLRDGTFGDTLPAGSNALIRRVLEFAFGAVEFQQAENTNLTTQVDLLNTGGDDLQTFLGLNSTNTLVGGRDLSAFIDIATLVSSANGALDDPNDQFQITFEEARSGLGPTTITVDLSTADTFPGATAIDQLVNHINNEIALAGVPPGLAAIASVGTNGELIINTRGSYEVDSNFGPTGLTEDGLLFLGIADNAGAPIAPTDPYFDVQVGNDDPVRIFLEPGDTSAELITKLQAVDGLAVDTVNFAIDGVLRLRAGNDFDNPDFGGDIRLTGGPFETLGATYGTPPATTVRTAIDDGVNIVSSLFGTYTIAGTSIIDQSPVNDVSHQSQTNGSLIPPIPTESFRSRLLGPGANISTNIIGSQTLADFGQQIINENAQISLLVQSQIDDESSLRDALQNQLLNESGVNLDEELGNLILAQTAYGASARVLSAIDELFQELLNAVR